ncbi:DUF4352 domain-containing protein [Virgibacillus sp. M23]|uniref:DUF4352 domain-containing protein n=1 Tax=Virgibacillus sp. M23 TaxID=3079030 RepID=UPI002A90F38E|nr:DUF4352 domain-containing protein [Virgibacillus sp. M23]MDY7045183.1 DUF4352 domain-containing protein [Virgibacillus sp. M23]
MKKLLALLVLLAVIAVAGCSDNDEGSKTEKTDANKEQATEANDDNNKGKDEEGEKVYQIGEAAQLKSDLYGFPYEVTVNSFELTTEPVNGVKLEDKVMEIGENHRFAVINVTIKNTGEKSFIPNEKISAQLVNETLSENSYDEEFFTERNKELKPGNEITGNLVYMSPLFFEEDVIYLAYELISSEETRWELPIPEK